MQKNKTNRKNVRYKCVCSVYLLPAYVTVNRQIIKIMKKTIVLSLLFISLSINGLTAQNSLLSVTSENNFIIGKELYNQQKYAASQRYFEDYLASSVPTQVGIVQETEYYLAAIAYQLQMKDAEEKLAVYLQKYPYSPFTDQVNFMQGMIMFQRQQYSKTLSYFKLVDNNKLTEHDRTEKMFCEAFSLLQTKKYDHASALFLHLKSMDTRYNLSARYYYAYSEYIQGNFDNALPDFLELESAPAYKKIVPYYIIQIYYNRNEYDKIGDRARTLLAEDPDNPNNAEIYRIVGEIAYRDADYEQTVSALKKYEALSPQVLRNDIYILGLSYYQLKDYANAILYLSKVTTKSDEMTENAYMHIGNSYIKQGDKVNARMAYEAALSTNFNKTIREEALYNYALTTYETNAAFGESVSAFERLLEEFPDSKYADQAYDYLSVAYMTSQNYKAAYESINKIKKVTPKLQESKQFLLNQLGAEDFVARSYGGAIERFTMALQQTPNKAYEAESFFWRAESYYRLGEYERAIDDVSAFFNNSRSINSPNLQDAYYLAGYSYFSLQRCRESLNYFQKYVANLSMKEPTYADAMNRMGDCYFASRDFVNAERSYSKAISASPRTGDYPLFQVAYVSGLQKKYTTKITHLERLINEYPRSQYADDALYEMGRSYLMLENNQKALDSYTRLLRLYPNSNLAPKTALEVGMIHLNGKEADKAIDAFKNVITSYPGSEESHIALESLEGVYIDKNNVAAYIEYTNSLGGTIQTSAVSREDSITFVAAEKQYIHRNYNQAVAGLKMYIDKFCDGGPNCTMAYYYLADSYYQSKDYDKALTNYQILTDIPGNKYMEEAVMRAAEITYDKKEYELSLRYFSRLQEIALSPENKGIARLGVLRCSYFLHDHQTTVEIATEILDDPQSSEDLKKEARYNRAKANLALGHTGEAIPDLKALGENTRTENGAESKFLLAEIYYSQGKLDEAENEIMDLAQKGTSFQYWLARSFIVLADIYISRSDDFQAKQYLLSLQKNYTESEEIQQMIKIRLDAISLREQEVIIN